MDIYFYSMPSHGRLRRTSMTIKFIGNQSASNPSSTIHFKLSWKNTKIFSFFVLLFLLICNVLPAGQAAGMAPSIVQAVSTHTFTAIADSYVEELHPANNNGTQTTLQVENVSKH